MSITTTPVHTGLPFAWATAQASLPSLLPLVSLQTTLYTAAERAVKKGSQIMPFTASILQSLPTALFPWPLRP